MNSHERILATLDRRPVDRVPVDVWLTPEVLDSLCKHVGEPDEYELYRKLGVDKIAWVFPGYGTEKFDPNVSQGIDPWGVPTVNVRSGLATYQEYGAPPLGEMASPEEIDSHLISDDMGTQESQLISVAAWKEHLQPRLSKWCELIHSHGKKVLFHTDGAARDFIPHLIESGVDVLNPIQHVCPGMERSSLKRDFGDKIIFHGGVENQHVLPHGTTEDVRKEVVTCLETLGADGGYIPCSCHNIQAGTPPENVIAMIETVQKWIP